jgi:hypothetical protein
MKVKTIVANRYGMSGLAGYDVLRGSMGFNVRN